MAENITIFNPTYMIDNEVIPTVPNSVMVNPGLGEVNIRAQSTGGGNVTTVASRNVETQVGKTSFSVYPTPRIIELLRKFSKKEALLVITVFGKSAPNGESVSWVFPNSAITNNPDLNLGFDTQIDVETMGSPST